MVTEPTLCKNNVTRLDLVNFVININLCLLY